MLLSFYKHIEFNKNPNKDGMPMNSFQLNDAGVHEFNIIYKYCLSHYMQVEPTPSGGIPFNHHVKYHDRFCVVVKKASFELIIASRDGCYRFVIKSTRDNKESRDSGVAATRNIYKIAKELGIDLTKYETPGDIDERKAVKNEINKAHIELLANNVEGRVLHNCFHIDINSAYGAKIGEEYPELLPIYEKVYNDRLKAKNEHDDLNNSKLKSTLTNSTGCFQSEFCPDFNDSRGRKPYAFTNLAKVAVNGCRKEIEDLIEECRRQGFIPILTNTDGIYCMSLIPGRKFKSPKIGDGLGQYKIDFEGDMIIKSKGSYQLRYEDGHIKTVVRGQTQLDKVKDRSEWYFGEILEDNACQIKIYSFEEKKGIVTKWLEM